MGYRDSQHEVKNLIHLRIFENKVPLYVSFSVNAGSAVKFSSNQEGHDRHDSMDDEMRARRQAPMPSLP